jgi:uncharacterized protein (TIGR03000 family)
MIRTVLLLLVLAFPVPVHAQFQAGIRTLPFNGAVVVRSSPTAVTPVTRGYPTPAFFPTQPFPGFVGGAYPLYGWGGYSGGSPIIVNQNQIVIQNYLPDLLPRPVPTDPVALLSAGYLARLTLQIPEGAEVWLDGKKVEQTGSTRFLDATNMQPGELRFMEIRILWKEGQRSFEETRKVPMRGGDSRTWTINSYPPKK